MFQTAANESPWRKSFSAEATRTGVFLLLLMTCGVWLFSHTLFSENFLPHQFCFGGDQRLVWTNAVSDLLIGISYVLISTTLVWLVYRAGKRIPYSPMFWAFGLFIVSCGATHFLEIVTLWRPLYWLAAATKVITALASAGTCVVLIYFASDILKFVMEQQDIAVLRGNERFHSLVQAAPMAVIGADREARITSWNPFAKKIFGWDQEEVLGKHTNLVPPELDEEQKSLRERTLLGQITTAYETVRLDRNGKRIAVSISVAPLYGEGGGLTGLMSVIEDISERKRIERELGEKSATLAAVTCSLNSFLENGDWGAASQYLLSFALRQTESRYGFLGVVLGAHKLRVLAHDGNVWDQPLSRDLYKAEQVQNGTDDTTEMGRPNRLVAEVIYQGKTLISNKLASTNGTHQSPSEQMQLESFLGVPIFKGSEIVGLIGVANRQEGYTGDEVHLLETMSQTTGVLYDNYRQSEKRQQLEEQRARLESEFLQSQKMEVLGQLAGGVAHDFNNMLMVLTSASELLEGTLSSNSAASPYLGQIRRTVERAAVITKQLLAFSRKQVLDVRPLDLHAILTDCEFMLPRLLGSDVELTFEHAARDHWIRVDEAQIEQVVLNLAINARDAMPGGGKLRISTRNPDSLPAEAPKDLLKPDPGGWILLEVADSGCGMDEATRKRIFEPFYTTKPLGKGTGLGLSTVFGVVSQFGGHIHVDSQPNAGTSFQIYFPLVEAPAPAKENGQSEASAQVQTAALTILLADDEPGLRLAIAEFLRATGHHVIAATTSLEAVELARKHADELDVLLTDIVMPGLRGPELARKVSELQPNVHVIYMSGYAEGLPGANIPAGATYLQKPFRFAKLAEQLRLVARKN